MKNTYVAMSREVKEEVGIDLQPETGRFICSEVRTIINGRKINDIKDVWLFQYDGEVDLKNAAEQEVAAVKWLYPHEIRQLFDDGKLVETLAYFFDDVVKQI